MYKVGSVSTEITSRLNKGLAAQFPDLQERVDHILTKQVFGIAITNLTSLLARRSVYCSKHANGPHSIAKSFASDEGNIWFERMEHTWAGWQMQILRGEPEELSTAAKSLKPTLMRSSTPTTSRLGWTSYLETICSSM